MKKIGPVSVRYEDGVPVTSYPLVEPTVHERQQAFGGHQRAVIQTRQLGLTGRPFVQMKSRRDWR
jgi:hypothetical protein